jgi:hypothetical protein
MFPDLLAFGRAITRSSNSYSQLLSQWNLYQFPLKRSMIGIMTINSEFDHKCCLTRCRLIRRAAALASVVLASATACARNSVATLGAKAQ